MKFEELEGLIGQIYVRKSDKAKLRIVGVVKKDTIVMENGKNNPDHLLFLENVETGHEERQWGNMFIANIARKDWKPIKDFKGEKESADKMLSEILLMVKEPEGRDLIIHIMKTGKIDRFEVKPIFVDYLERLYLSLTGEKLPPEALSIQDIWSIEMRLMFTKTSRWNKSSVEDILPNLERRKSLRKYSEENTPVKERGPWVVIENNNLVEALLQMGFRFDTGHNQEKIMGYLNKEVK